MRIAFAGTPRLGRDILRGLVEAGRRVCLVITAPDKPRGRGLIPAPSAVKEEAVRLSIPVAQPSNLKDPSFSNVLRQAAPDVMVCVAYGKLIPGRVLDFPPLGCVNVHPSLLPRWRGAAPIQWALIEGDRRTGVTTMFMSRGLDEGDTILQEAFDIGPDDTAGTLEEKASEVGLRLLLRTLDLIARGAAPRHRQNQDLATYAPPIRAEMEWIDWTQPATRCVNLVRALNPSPGAKTLLGQKVLKIWKAKEVEAAEAAAMRLGGPGEAVGLPTREGLLVRTGEGYLLATEVQLEGRRRMSSGEFLLGRPLDAPARLLGPEI